jgi:hypothetical protein
MEMIPQADARPKSGRGLPALQDLADIGRFSTFAKRLGVRAVLCRFFVRLDPKPALFS